MEKKIGYYLINEELPPSQPQILDSKKKYVTIKTVLQDFKVNRNNRLYDEDVLKTALNSDYVKERLTTKTFYGEAGHPFKADVQRQLHYDQNNLSHIVTSISFEDNMVKAIVEGADTIPAGRNFNGLVRQGSKVAFSMRGLSDVIEKSGNITKIKGPLIVFCYDWVIHPSHAQAYMEKVLDEDMKMLDNNSKKMLSESGLNIDTILNKEIPSFIKNNSPRIKNISEQLEFNPEIKVLNENQVILSGKDKNKMVINVEDFISNNYKSYLRKLKI